MSKKICFTVCSLNKLGQAIALFQSFLQHNPLYDTYIGLADEIHERIDIKSYLPIQFIPLSQLQFEEKEYVITHYNIFQICCILKPFFATYFLQELHANTLIYLDTDMYVYNSFECVELALRNKSIILTPHILNPIAFNDNKKPSETDMIATGLFNAGFFAVTPQPSTLSFLNWWGRRIIKYGYTYSVDQNWLNLVPIFFFEHLYILREEGINVAHWNLQERLLSEKNDQFFINSKPLILFHFSQFNYQKEPLQLSTAYINLRTEVWDNNPAIVKLITQYKNQLTTHNKKHFDTFKPVYGKKKVKNIKTLLIKILQLMNYRIEKIK